MDEVNAAAAEQDADETSLLDLALVVAENLRLLILVPLAAGLAGLGIGFLTPPMFTATARIMPPTHQPQSTTAVLAAQFGALAGFAGSAGYGWNPVDQFAAMIRSRTVADAMIERFKLKQLYDEKYTVEARKVLERRTKVSAGVKDGIISIEVDDRDPTRAADMANAYVEELRNLSRTLAVTEAAQRRLFFETHLKQTKDNLAKAEIALRGSGVSEAALKTVPQSAMEALARIKAQITVQEVKLASMRTYMTDANPDFKLVLQELTALRTELSKAEQSNTGNAAGEGAEYITKFREFKYHETLFELMAKQYELARLDEARHGAAIQVVDAALPPERKSGPKKTLIAILTAFFAFVLLLPVVFVRQALRNLARNNESAEKLGRLRQLLRLRRA